MSNNIRKGIFQNNSSNTIDGLQSYIPPKYTALNSQIANNLYKNQGKYALREKSNYSSLAINSYNNRNYSRNYNIGSYSINKTEDNTKRKQSKNLGL